MSAIWINGWGLCRRYTRNIVASQYPNIEHTVINPDIDWSDQLEKLPISATLLGYSLGAFLLLSRPDLRKRFQRVVLLAPFVDFKRESDLGGKVRRAQLHYLQRWLKRDPGGALSDFWDQANIGHPPLNESDLDPVMLDWGVSRLLEGALDRDVLSEEESWVGSEDSLLDASKLAKINPKLNIVNGVGHGLEELLSQSGIEL